jgi:hypothetical protein
LCDWGAVQPPAAFNSPSLLLAYLENRQQLVIPKKGTVEKALSSYPETVGFVMPVKTGIQ